MVPTFGNLVATATRAERTRLQEPCCQAPVESRISDAPATVDES